MAQFLYAFYPPIEPASFTKASPASDDVWLFSRLVSLAPRRAPIMSHFLFVAGALRERTSEESAELQLGHGLWGLCTGLIRTNLQTYLEAESRGLLYVLKVGLCAEFQIVPPVLDFSALDAFLSDELRTEARFGFVRIGGVRRFSCSSATSQALLLNVLQIADQAELTRRLKLGMHRLTQAEYDAILQGVTASNAG
jgi:hypothetical protein